MKILCEKVKCWLPVFFFSQKIFTSSPLGSFNLNCLVKGKSVMVIIEHIHVYTSAKLYRAITETWNAVDNYISSFSMYKQSHRNDRS